MTMPLTLLLITVSSLPAIVSLIYQRDMPAARARLRGRSTLLPSPYGNIEYAEGGAGVDLLIVHAAAGGWDQGELIGDAVLYERFHRIAPSRFGYLRSDGPAGALLFTAVGIPRAQPASFEAGGHQRATIRAAVEKHILAHAMEGADVASRPCAS